MRSRRPRSEHQQAVSRRLAELSEELAAGRAAAVPTAPASERPPGPPPEPPAAAAGQEWWGDHTRVTPAVRATARPAPPLRLVPDPPAVPVPGRHAARRADPGPRTPRWVLAPGQLAVVAVVVAIGALTTAVLVVRHDPAPAEPTLAAAPAPGILALPAEATAPTEPAGTGQATGTAEPTDPAGSATGETVTVDVAGRVRRPGIAVLDVGARVVDALEAAGGARPGVDLTTLNLARPLVDGEQILVGEQAAVAPAVPTPLPSGSSGSTGAGVPAAPVDLNTATAAELDLLPEVGPVTAAAILAWRDEHGGFTAVEELLEVDGIGDVTFGRIAPHVTV